jgi:hypothetical protein
VEGLGLAGPLTSQGADEDRGRLPQLPQTIEMGVEVVGREINRVVEPTALPE